jgi:hypothetical protein
MGRGLVADQLGAHRTLLESLQYQGDLLGAIPSNERLHLAVVALWRYQKWDQLAQQSIPPLDDALPFGR